MAKFPKLFEYIRHGHLELARYHDELHIAVTQSDGTAATYRMSAEEAADLGGRLIGMAADAVTVRERGHVS